MVKERTANPIMFGAKRGDGGPAFTFDSSDAVEAWCGYVSEVSHDGEVLPGGYIISRTFYLEPPFRIRGLGALNAWETPFYDLASIGVEGGAHFIAKGMGPRVQTLDFCSALRYGGLARINPKRLHNNAHDQYFDASDFTNGNAVGATRATLKPFSAVFVIGIGGTSGKWELSNIRVLPACDDGVNGPFSGYIAANMETYVPWDEWDVGIYALNPYHAHADDLCSNGFWHMGIGFLQTSIRGGNAASGGRGEGLELNRPDFNGYVIKQGDPYAILSKTASSVVVPWNPGHRFLAPGVVYVETTQIAYDGVSHNQAGEGTLELTGVADTSWIVPGEHTLCMVNNNGVSQAKITSPRWRDFNHPSGAERPSSSFGDQAGKYQAPVEFAGWPIRAVTIENQTLYTSGPLTILQLGGARDIKIWGGTYEEKAYRATIGGPANPDGACQGLYVCGPDVAHKAHWPELSWGSVELQGYALSGRINLQPLYPSHGRRYSGFTDVFNPFFFDPGKVFAGTAQFYDARLPIIATVTGTSGVDAVLHVFSEEVIVAHSGLAPLIITKIRAPWWIKRVRVSQANSSNDIEFKQGTGPEEISLGGSNLRLYSALQGVVFSRRSVSHAWTIDNNPGATATYLNSVKVVGGMVVDGT